MTPLLVFQLRRVARNRQFLIFTVLMPALFTIFFTKIFGGQAPNAAQYQEFAGYYMVSMMAYGALGAALGATIRISFDRASGWLRQLRITPVPQTPDLRRRRRRRARCSRCPGWSSSRSSAGSSTTSQLGLGTWVALVGVLWAGSIAFVAFGLLIGLSLDEKAAGGAIGFVGVVLAALGGLWVPVEVFPESMRTVAHAMPSYWYAQLGRDVAAGGAASAQAVLVLAAFTAVFAVLAVAVARRRPLYAVSG